MAVKIDMNELLHIVGGASSEPVDYVVKKGDTLSKIASRFGLTISELESRNPSRTVGAEMVIGEVLHIY